MNLFASYEREGFDISNVRHKFALQYMFKSRIQDQLSDFKLFWNNRPMITENNRSPLQQMLLRCKDINFDEPIDMENFGADDEEAADMDKDEINPQVSCDPIICPLTDGNLIELQLRISPLDTHTPVYELTNRFHAALKIILDYRDLQ
jgi:hypothetical protein